MTKGRKLSNVTDAEVHLESSTKNLKEHLDTSQTPNDGMVVDDIEYEDPVPLEIRSIFVYLKQLFLTKKDLLDLYALV